MPAHLQYISACKLANAIVMLLILSFPIKPEERSYEEERETFLFSLQNLRYRQNVIKGHCLSLDFEIILPFNIPCIHQEEQRLAEKVDEIASCFYLLILYNSACKFCKTKPAA